MEYLVDENVLKEIRSGGNANVLSWHRSLDQAEIFFSVVTLFEKRRGWERKRRANPEMAAVKLAELDEFAAVLDRRLLPIDAPIVVEWARLVGLKDKNRLDRALGATARVHDLVLVTRNIADMRGCDVRVLDPFRKPPKIERV